MNSLKTRFARPRFSIKRPTPVLLRSVAVALGLLAAAQGCDPSDVLDDGSDPSSEESSALPQVVASDAGARDAGGVPPDAGGSPAVRPTWLTFRMNTAPFGGRYKPRNIGAVWVETSTGTYVKTLKRWARIRARYLTRFSTASRNNLVDAVTGATLANHNTVHEIKWNLTDVSRTRVPDGQYRLALELTDKDGPGALHYIPFTIGAWGARSTPPATPQFLNMELVLQ